MFYSLHLNSGVECKYISSIGSLFQQQKNLSPNLRFVHGTMKSPWLDDQTDRTEGLLGTSAARVNRSLRYLGEQLS